MARALVLGRPFDDGVQMGPVIDGANCERILAVIDDARRTGAGTLLTGGERAGGELADGFFVLPTVFGDVDNASEIAQARGVRAGGHARRASRTRTTRSRLARTEPATDSEPSSSRATSDGRTASRRAWTPATWASTPSPDATQRPLRRRQAERLRARGRPRRRDGVPPRQERVRRARPVSTTGLLDGVRVLEVAVLFNGDVVGQHLGDLGADVIKLESPGRGDYLRDMLGQLAPHQSPAHLQVNRNKRSVTLDVRTDAGRDTSSGASSSAPMSSWTASSPARAIAWASGTKRSAPTSPTSSTRTARASARSGRTPRSPRTAR